MGLIGRVLSFIWTSRHNVPVGDVKLDPGGGANNTGEHYAPPGDDSQPLPNDYVYAGDTPQQGRRVALGYIDPVNTHRAQPGEKRIYARDAESGTVVSEVWLKSDGTVFLSNGTAFVTLQPTGDILANDAVITADGDIVTSDGISLRHHTHTQDVDSAGNTQQDTGEPI